MLAVIVDVGAHVRQQQAVAVAGEAESDGDHRGARQQCARRRWTRRDRPCAVSGIAASSPAPCGASGHARPPEAHALRSQSRQVCSAGCLAVVRLETSRSNSCSSWSRSAAVSTSSGRGQGLVALLAPRWRHDALPAAVRRSRRSRESDAATRVTRPAADQPVDESRRTRARQPQDVAEPGDRAVRVGKQGHQRRHGRTRTGHGSSSRPTRRSATVSEKAPTRFSRRLMASIVQYLTDAGK